MPQAVAVDAARRNLAELGWLRSALLLLFLLTALWCQAGQDAVIAWPSGLLLVYGLLLLINLLTALRLRGPAPVHEDELFLQLVIDLVLLTVLFRQSGGSSNPFVTYYLVPLAIAASTLSWRQTGALALLVLAAYSGLFWWPPADTGVPWPWLSYHAHLLGMWANFAISAVLLAFFLGRMHRRLRAQDRYLAEQQRHQLQRDQAVAMGTLAAGAVHELATPLGTMTLLADELAELTPGEPALAQLHTQLRRCRDILAHLREQARHPEHLPSATLREAFLACLQPLQAAFPRHRFSLDLAGLDARRVVMPWLLQQVIYNGAKNAAEAAVSQVSLSLATEGGQLLCRIHDDGPGFSEERLKDAQRPQGSSKADGLGIGLFLAQVTLGEMGGALSLANPAGGGAELCIRVPWRCLDESEELA